MKGRWVALAVCAVGALAGSVHWLVQMREATAPPAPEAYVSVSWEVVRDAPGHRAHVEKQQLACTKCHVADDWASEDKDELVIADLGQTRDGVAARSEKAQPVTRTRRHEPERGERSGVEHESELPALRVMPPKSVF